MADSAKKKRPAPEAPPGNPLATLADQISYFEELAESQGDHQEAKKPAKVGGPRAFARWGASGAVRCPAPPRTRPDTQQHGGVITAPLPSSRRRRR